MGAEVDLRGGKVHEPGYSRYDIDLEKWAEPKPFGISGLFRIRDDQEFMELAVRTHLKWLDEAVLILQPSDDKTMEVGVKLASDFPEKVRLCYYPFDVARIGTPDHFELPENSIRTMMWLTNWGIAQCRYSWIAKIEADVLGLPQFGDIRFEIENNPDQMAHFGRVGLNLAGGDWDLFSWSHPRNAGWDESVFNNHPHWYCVRNDKWETINMHHHPDQKRCLGWSFLHLKRCKVDATEEGEKWWPLTPKSLATSLAEYGQRHPYPGEDDDENPARWLIPLVKDIRWSEMDWMM